MPTVLSLFENSMFLCAGTQWLPETGDHGTTVGGVQQSEYSVGFYVGKYYYYY